MSFTVPDDFDAPLTDEKTSFSRGWFPTSSRVVPRVFMGTKSVGGSELWSGAWSTV